MQSQIKVRSKSGASVIDNQTRVESYFSYARPIRARLKYKKHTNCTSFGNERKTLLRVGFKPTPFRTRTLIGRLRPTRPSQHAIMNQGREQIWSRCHR